MSLAFGLRTAPTTGVASVWGARLIWPADLVHDRQDMQGSGEGNEALQTWLNGGALRAALDRAADLASTWELRPSENREVVLYEDEHGVIKANPQGSHGYLYVAAWLKADHV